MSHIESNTLESPPERHAPLALWQAAHALLSALFNLFGAPQEIAARDTLSKDARTLLLTWLRVAEAIVRRLIFIEAQAISPPPTPPSAAKSKPTRATRRPLSFDASTPEAWRVSFRCSTPDRRRPQRRSLRRHAPKRAIRARPLAQRCEALLRAFNDPMPFARRLARRLSKPDARRAHDEPPPNTRDLYGRECYDRLDFHYRSALCGNTS